MSAVDISEEGACVVARLHGDIDSAEIEFVSNRIIGGVGDERTDVVIDLSDVTYLDSAGIQMLFELIRKFHGARQGIAVAVPEQSPLVTLLKITHIHEACPVAPSVEECMEALGADPKLY